MEQAVMATGFGSPGSGLAFLYAEGGIVKWKF
jgi:hypothetical protein